MANSATLMSLDIERKVINMRVFLPLCAVLISIVHSIPAFAREIVVCNYIGFPKAETKPYEIAPGTMLKCKDKDSKIISNSLAGLYHDGYHLISAISFNTGLVEGKQIVTFQYYLEK